MNVKVFTTRAPDNLDAAISDLFFSDMPDYKRERILRQKKDPALDLTADRLVRYALFKVFGIRPKRSDWALAPYGKPYLRGFPEVFFSLSHSHGMALAAVHDLEVGADIERIKPVDVAVAKRIMSQQEYEYFEQSGDRLDAFFNVWTLKESYLKFTGRGITVPLKDITIFPSENGITTNTQHCTFTLIDSLPSFMAAVRHKGAEVDFVEVDLDTLCSF